MSRKKAKRRTISLQFRWHPKLQRYTLDNYPGWELEVVLTLPQEDGSLYGDSSRVAVELTYPNGEKEVGTLEEALAVIAVDEGLIKPGIENRLRAALPEDRPEE